MPISRLNGFVPVLRWLSRTAAIGFASALAMTFLINGFRIRHAVVSGLIGVVFSVIMWGGFQFGSGWVERASRRSLLLAQLRWGILYSGLYLLCLGAVRLLFGLNLGREPVSLGMTFLLGYAISSSIVGYHAAKNLARTERELEQARSSAKIQALKAQLSPHTLFNALNTIAALIPEAPAAAETAVEDLSRFLRRVLEALELERWSLREEFDLLRALIGVEQARFGDRLRVRLELPEALADREIPPLLLLPLVENSLKHGFRPKIGPCSLAVVASAQGIRIEDDGVGRSGQRLGIGLESVRRRLEAAGGSLDWPACAAGCIVEVRLCP